MFRHPVRIPIKSVQEMEPCVVLRELDPSACAAGPLLGARPLLVVAIWWSP